MTDLIWRKITRPIGTPCSPGDRQILSRATDFYFDVALGVAHNTELVLKFGRNPDITTGGVPEDIWNGGGAYTGFPLGDAELVTVTSDSSDDTSEGSGARMVQIFGLDENWEKQNEIITLAGTSLVDSVGTYRRVNRCRVLTSGSSNQAFAAGTISVAHKTTTSNIFVVMPNTYNQSTIAAFTIPANKTGYIRKINLSVNRNNTAIIEAGLWVRNFESSPRIIRPFTASNTGPFIDDITGAVILPEKTDITMRVLDTSATCAVTANMDIILVNN